MQDLHEQLASTESKLVFVVEMAYDLIVEATKGTKIEKIVSIPIEYSMPATIKAAASLKQKHPKLNDISVKWKIFLSDSEGEFKPVEFDSSDMAVIEYTGGTTGVPKGVMISNDAGNAYAHNYLVSNNILFVEKNDTFLNILPPFIALGIFAAVHMPLCFDVEVILFPDSNPKKMAENILKFKPNHFCGGPLHLNNIITSLIMY